MLLKDKVVLITGAMGGLGTFVTRRFLDEGAFVHGVSRSIQDSDFPQPNFSALRSNLSSAADAKQVAAEVIEKRGRIDTVVHLVGGFGGGSLLDETGDEVFEQMFEQNFYSALHLFRTVIPFMRSARQGRILAIASRAAVEPSSGVSAYAASKAALVSLVRSLAVENADHGVCANVLFPGTIDTPANRAAMPTADFSTWTPAADVADTLAHLASMSGSFLPIE